MPTLTFEQQRDLTELVKYSTRVNANHRRAFCIQIGFKNPEVDLSSINIETSDTVTFSTELVNFLIKTRNIQKLLLLCNELVSTYEGNGENNKANDILAIKSSLGVELDSNENSTETYWDILTHECHDFNQNYIYIGIVGPQTSLDLDSVSPIVRIPWSVIIDFDPDSQETGLYSHANKEFGLTSPEIITIDTSQPLTARQQYWYMARGRKGLVKTHPTKSTSTDWAKYHDRPFRDFLSKLLKLDPYQVQSVNVILLWDEFQDSYLIHDICQAIYSIFADRLRLFIVSDKPDKFKAVIERFQPRFYPMSLNYFSRKISDLFVRESDKYDHILIPNDKGERAVIPQDDFRRMSELLDVVHIHAGDIDSPSSNDDILDFYFGRTITWYEIKNSYAIRRSIEGMINNKTMSFEDILSYHLHERHTGILSLIHEAGAGGTTLSRSVGWSLRGKYPVVIIESITDNLLSCLISLYKHSGEHSILAIIEEKVLKEDHYASYQFWELVQQVQSEKTPILFLLVRSTLDLSIEVNIRPQFHLGYVTLRERLEGNDAKDFERIYCAKAPRNCPKLKLVINDPIPYRTPFIYALTAFEDEFVRLPVYVKVRLDTIGSEQRQMLAFLAMSDLYSEIDLPLRIFNELLGLLPKDDVLREHLHPATYSLLKDRTNQHMLYVRPMHKSVSAEILRQIFYWDGNTLSYEKCLTDWCCLFLEFLKQVLNSGSLREEFVQKIIMSMFIDREHEIYQTPASEMPKYTNIIMKVQEFDYQERVFRELPRAFPDQAHLYAHLARYYSEESPVVHRQEAIDAIEAALNLGSAYDPILHHICGEVFQNAMRADMTDYQKTGNEDLLSIIDEHFNRSLEAYRTSIAIRPNKENSFTGAIFTLVRMVEFAYQRSDYDSVVEFFANTKNTSQYEDYLSEANNLLYKVKQLWLGGQPSVFVKEADKRILRLYKDYEALIQYLLREIHSGQSLVRNRLALSDTMLKRRQYNWDRMTQSEIIDILEYMEANIGVEPQNEYNYDMWFNARCHADIDQELTDVIEKVEHWANSNKSLKPYFYLYMLHIVNAIRNKSISSRHKYRQALDQCQSISRRMAHPFRHQSQYLLGKDDGLRALVEWNDTRLGKWNVDGSGFFAKPHNLLHRCFGYVSSTSKVQTGIIEVEDLGIEVHFVPRRRDQTGDSILYREGDYLSFYLGFRYSGPEAWSYKKESK